jgi:hypothetical protein
MAKFHRRIREDKPTTTEMTHSEATMAIHQAELDAEANDQLTSVRVAISALTDAQLKDVVDHVRTLRKLRREARKPAPIIAGTQVVWSVLRKRGEVSLTGEVVGCRGRNAYVKTSTGIEVVKIGSVRKVIGDDETL